MHGIARLQLDSLQPRLKQAAEDYKQYSAELAQECLARSTATPSEEKEKESACVFDVLLEGYRQKRDDAPSISELESEASLLVLAGMVVT
jgi:hypothetical protein